MSSFQQFSFNEPHYVITGGAGFLGSHIIAALQINGDFTPCIVLDPSPPRHHDTIRFDPSYVNYIQGSFLDENILNAILPNASTVFHLCAIGHTGRYGARKYRKLVYEFNVDGTRTLIRKCKEHAVQRFIYSSSVAVVFVGKPLYSCDETTPYPDENEFLDIYSLTKAKAEEFIRSQSSSTFKTTCLRFRAIYGPQDVTVAEKVVRMVEKGLFMVKISKHQTESISQMSSGRNCGQAFHLANQALSKASAPHGKVYFITDDETIGQYTIWTPLIEALGKCAPVQSIPYPIVSLFVSVSSFLFYEIFNSSPPMTRFELEVLVTNNTYSIEAAKRDLGYSPGENHFKEVVDYYRTRTHSDSPPITTVYFDFDTVVFMIFMLLWTLFTFWNSY